MTAEVVDFRLRENGSTMRRKSLSAIERIFPRIADELAKRWFEAADIDAYLDGLLIDTRGDRMGFPAEVMDELLALSATRWQLGYEYRDVMDQPHAQEFSFCAREDQQRLCGTSGAWVLV